MTVLEAIAEMYKTEPDKLTNDQLIEGLRFLNEIFKDWSPETAKPPTGGGLEGNAEKA